MTPSPVTDPDLLQRLEASRAGSSGPVGVLPTVTVTPEGATIDSEPQAAEGPQPVTDPDLLRRLGGGTSLPPEVGAQDPARVGRVNQMTRDTGLPREAVDQELDHLEAKAARDRALEVAKDAPATRRRLNDPATAAPTQADVDNMVLTEKLGSAFKRSWTTQKQGWSVGRMRAYYDALATFDRIDALPEGERLPADQDPIGYQDMDPLTRRAVRLDTKLNLQRNVDSFRSSAEQLKMLGPQTSQMQRMAGAGNDVGDFLSAWLEAPVEAILLLGAESAVPIAEAALLSILGGGVGSLVARGAGAAAGAATGQFTGSYMGDFNAGVLSGLADAGVNLADPQAVATALSDPELRAKIGRDANAHALGVAVMDTAALGLIPTGKIAEAAAERGFGAGLKETAKESVRQLPAQAAAGAGGEQLGTILETGKPADFAETAMEALGEAIGGPVDVISYTAGQGLGKVAEKTVDILLPSVRRAREAEARAAQQKAIIESSAASSARAHDPQAFAEFVAESTGGAETHIDADVFRQSAQQAGVDIAAVDPELAAAIDAAAETGADVRIPVGDVAAKYSGTPLAQLIIDHGRHSAGAMSLAEAAVFRQVEPELFQQAVRDSVAETVAETQAERERNIVTRWLRQSIARAGFESNAAEHQALIGAAMVTTMGARTGRTPLQMLQAWPLKIRSMAGVSGLVNEIMASKVEAFRNQRTEAGRAREEASPRRGIDEAQARVDRSVERMREAEASADPEAIQAAQLDIAQNMAVLESLHAEPPAVDNLTRLEDTLTAANELVASLERDGLEGPVLDRLRAAIEQYGPRAAAAREGGDRSEVDLAVPAAADGSTRTLADAMVADIENIVDGLTGTGPELAQALSSRVPAGVRAQEDGLATILDLGTDVLVRDPTWLDKNIGQLVDLLPFRFRRGSSRQAQLEQIVSTLADNLLFLYDMVPEPARSRIGNWYVGANRLASTFADRYGISLAQAAAGIAVLSPQTDWFQNVSRFERVADILFGARFQPWTESMESHAKRIGEKIYSPEVMDAIRGKRLADLLDKPKMAAAWIRLYDEANHSKSYREIGPDGAILDTVLNGKGEPAGMPWDSFSEIGKAVSVLLDARAENLHYQLGTNHKVRNFYNNIFNPADPRFVTIDTHAIAGALLQPQAASDTFPSRAFGAGASSLGVGLSGDYAIYVEAFRRAAGARGVLMREMQSVAWEAAQQIFPRAIKKHIKADVEAIWAEHKAGRLGLEETRLAVLAVLQGDRGVDPVAALTRRGETPTETGNESTYERTIRVERQGPADVGPAVIFEVAPNPDDASATDMWNALPPAQREAISEQVAAHIINAALAEVGAAGRVTMQLGGYAGLSNPSLALALDTPEVAMTVTRLLGFALRQREMMVLSQTPFAGSMPGTAYQITLPEGYGAPQIEELYNRLYKLERNGAKVVAGHSSMDGVMTILHNDETGLTAEETAGIIDRELGGAMEVSHGDVHFAFPGESEYAYDSPETAATARRANQLRATADQLIAAAVAAAQPVEPSVYQQSVGRGEPAGGPAATGSNPVRGIHFSHQPRVTLDGRKYGTGIAGRERNRVDESPDVRLKSRVYFYIDNGGGVAAEQGLGAVSHEIELPTLYDLVADPDGFGRLSPNEMETALLDNGYHGYFDRGRPGFPGVGVIIGPASHNVAATPRDAAKWAPQQPQQEQQYKGSLLSSEIRALEPHMEEIRAVAPSATLQYGLFKVNASEEAAARAAAKALGVDLPAQSLRQTVFHGTPHIFNRFDLSKIGTGEGAQVYGWGIYFAEERAVAAGYRERLASEAESTIYTVDGVDLPKVEWGSPEDIVLSEVAGGSTVDSPNIGYWISYYREDGQETVAREMEAAREKYRGAAVTRRLADEGKGALYTLNLPDDAVVLDRDAPLSEQHPVVQAAMQALAGSVFGSKLGDMPGGTLYDFLKGRMGSAQAASEALDSLGVVGLRYLDAYSRDDGEGTRNLVIWNQPLLDRVSADMNAELFQKAGEREVVTGPEREANFAAWFAGSKIVNEDGSPKVMYHGTTESFDSFRRSYRGFTFVTPDPYFAEEFTGPENVLDDPDGPQGGNIMPMFVSAKNPFDYENPQHVEAVWNAIPGSWRGKSMGNSEEFLESLRLGEWHIIEEREVQQAIRGLGFDSFYVEEGEVKNLAVYNENQLKSATGNAGTFDSSDSLVTQRAGARDTVRGTFNPGTLTLTLLESANLTTFIHEMGHFGLEVLFGEAARDGAPADIVNDAKVILEWFGVESLDAWNAMTIEQKRPFHEKFAEGWETYAIEGRSPSPALTKAFRSFKRWFIQAYGALVGMRVQLTPEVRAVFDRMIATEQEIAAAERDRGMVAAFNEASDAGAPTKAWLDLQRMGQEATEESLDQLTSRSLKDLRWLSGFKSKVLKKLQQQAKSIRKALTEKYGEQVDSRPVYQAISLLTLGETFPPLTAEAKAALGSADDRSHRLDREALVALFGDGPDAAWRRLPDEMISITKQGQDPEQIATLFGFDSADAMIRAILDADPREQVIEGMVDKTMLEEHADLSDNDAIEAATDEAIVNEARTRFVAAELKAFEDAMNAREVVGTTTVRRGRNKGQQRVVTVNGLLRAAREHAEIIIGQTVIRRLDRRGHLAAARRESILARNARVAGDLRLAARHKRNQLVHAELARETMAAVNEVKKNREYLSRLRKSKGTRKNIDVDQREQIDAILDIIDTSSRSNVALDRLNAMRAWVQKQQDAGLPVGLDPDVVASLGTKHLREYTVDDMRSLVEQIKSIEAVGRLKKKLLTAKDKREFNAIMDEGEASIRGHGGKAKTLPIAPNAAEFSKGRMIRAFALAGRKLSSLARVLDGHKDNGWFWRTFVRPMNEAGDRETALLRHTAAQMREIFQPLMKMKGGLTGDKRLVKSTGQSWSREMRISLALNWGNEGNRRRVLNKFTEQQVNDVFALITREEWQAIERVWAMIDQFWPDIAALNRRLGADAPKKVLATPFTVTLADGSTMDISGGYYPLRYEPLSSNRAAKFDELQNLQQVIQGGHLNPTTRRGHEKARAENVNDPLRLTLDVLGTHITNVIHDLSWREWLIDANRITGDDRIANAIREHYSPEFLRAIKDTVLDVATGDQNRATAISRALTWARGAVTASTMGFSFTTALLQPFGIFQAIPRVGAGWLLRGVSHWAGDLATLQSSAEKIYKLSPFMKNRGLTMNRDLREIMQQVHHGKSQLSHMKDASMFYMMQKLQQTVDIPVWWGAYEKSLASNPGDTELAARLADQAVKDTQGSGVIADMAAWQRGGELSKLMTMFYSYFSATYNQIAEVTGQTSFKNPAQIAAWIGNMVALTVVPVVAQELVFEFIRSVGGDGDDKDPDEVAEDIFLEWLSFLMGAVPIVREASGAVKGFDYSGPAAFRVVSESVNGLREGYKMVTGEDTDGENYRRAVKAVLTVLGLPAAQVNRSWRGIEAWMDGEAGPGAILLGPPAESNRK